MAWAQQNPNPDPLEIEPRRDSVTVSESVEAESPALIDVVNRSQIEEIPGVNLDDRLRNIPGFSMFRRSSSLVAHPTTQGVNLRGMGSSGASRTVLLWDGIPVNSTFGGWIYWSRLDPELMDRVEVSRGSTTSVWGDRSMGGTINMFSRDPTPMNLTAGATGGNAGQVELTGGFSNLWDNRFGASAYVRGFTTNGYFIVPESSRGAIDTRAGTDFVAGVTRFDYLGPTERVFLRFDALGEQRDNGTTVQKNSSSFGTVALSWARELDGNSLWASAYHTREGFHASFSSVADDRNSENLVNSQETESEASGFAGLWRHNGSNWNTVAGADYTYYAGGSIDHNPFNGSERIGAGTRNAAGFFGQWNGQVKGVQLFLGSRFDSLGNGRAFYSPNGGLSYSRGIWKVRGSLYRSFRAPTLNELYRPFRVGTVFTLANDQLKPERLFGAEIGFDLTGERRLFSATYYRNSLRDAITNVTIDPGCGAPICRQRQNLDNAITHGVELSYRETFSQHWQGQISYLFANSEFENGLRVPQIPRGQGTVQVTWVADRAMISVGVRAYSSQFEDDLNTLEMGGFATVLLAAKYQLRPSLYATAQVDNLFDKEFLVGLPGIPQIGNPQLFRLGLRWDGPIR